MLFNICIYFLFNRKSWGSGECGSFSWFIYFVVGDVFEFGWIWAETLTKTTRGLSGARPAINAARLPITWLGASRTG